MFRILAAPATNDLTTLAAVRRELELSSDDSPSTQDERLSDIISTASDLVTQYCNRDTFGLQTIEQTEYLRQQTQGIVLVNDLNPVITSVSLNDVELDASQYVLDGSILRQPISSWSGGWRHCAGWYGGKIVITYDAGFALLDDLPRAIERACQDVVFSLYRRISSTRDQTVRSETIDGIGTTTYATGTVSSLPLAPDRLIALDRYKRFGGF